MQKVKLIDLVNRKDELEDRIATIDFFEKNGVLKAWPAIEAQFQEVKREWEREYRQMDKILNMEIDPAKLPVVYNEHKHKVERQSVK